MNTTLDDHSFGRPSDPCSGWFEKALHGDEAAATRLYHYCVPRLRHWFTQRLGESLAAELAHDTFVQAFEKGALFRPGTSFMPWLRTLGWRRALKNLRDAGRKQSHFTAWLAQQDLADSPEMAEENERRLKCLRQCLGDLPKSQRELVLRRYMIGRSCQSIADELGQTRTAVNVRLMRVRQRLRHNLRTKHGLTHLLTGG